MPASAPCWRILPTNPSKACAAIAWVKCGQWFASERQLRLASVSLFERGTAGPLSTPDQDRSPGTSTRQERRHAAMVIGKPSYELSHARTDGYKNPTFKDGCQCSLTTRS